MAAPRACRDAVPADPDARAEFEAQNERLHAVQRSLEESRDRYADLFDFSPIPYLVIDVKGIIQDINLTAAVVLGIRRSQVRRMPFVTLVAPGHQPRFWDHMDRCRRGAVNLSTDLDLQLPGGGALPVALVTAPHSRPGAVEFRTALIDLRQRLQLAEQQAALAREQARREQAERSDSSKDELLAMLAHDLRGPLSAIDTWTHLLSTDRLGPDERRRAIEVIDRNVRAQAALISEMIEVSRIIRGTLAMERAPVDLIVLLNSVLQELSSAATERRVRLESHLDPLAASASGDPERLRQVFTNMLSTAVQSTPTGGRVHVHLARSLWRHDAPVSGTRTSMTGECARVTVHQDGAGITPDELAHLFERFWLPRSDRSPGGLTMGPGLVRRLVELQGGHVHATSEGPGRGLVLTIELPLEIRPPALRALHPVPRRRLDGVRVLVVDDEAASIEHIRALLEPYGVSIAASRSVVEAIDSVRRTHPDVLIAGLTQAEEDGVSLIRCLRELPLSDGGATPAIAVSGRLTPDGAARMASAGYGSFLTRPVNGRRLGALIAQLTAGTRRGE